uniref:Uncharacterized protein n=1 Tax=Anguilla anguilla TaxID=7936 RepID=A0A0E9RMZ1_ANGAN
MYSLWLHMDILMIKKTEQYCTSTTQKSHRKSHRIVTRTENDTVL